MLVVVSSSVRKVCSSLVCVWVFLSNWVRRERMSRDEFEASVSWVSCKLS